MKLSSVLRAKIAFIIALLGIADAGFLSYQHFSYDPFVCPAFGGCETVTTSDYAVLFGIPTALLGVLFYLGMTAVLAWYISTLNKNAFLIASIGSGAGFLFSLYLVYLQIGVIGAICFYCMLSAFGSTLLFLLLGFPKLVAIVKSSDRLNQTHGRRNTD